MIRSAPMPREAWFYEPLPDGRVHCTLCPHSCRISDGYRGVCGVRINHRGVLFTLVSHHIVSWQVDPIEKKPLFHFMPGSTTYSIATVGCSLQCPFCQNWEISQFEREERTARRVHWTCAGAPSAPCPQLEALEREVPGEAVNPEAIVAAARRSGARSVAYTYTEPTVFYELACDTAARVRAAGLKNVFVTSGFIDDAPLRKIAPLLDAANVDLKFFRADHYARISRARLEPVLDAIRLYHELGVWVEVTTLVIPGLNDSDEELGQIAAFIHSVDRDVPWHVTRFHPAYRMLDRPPTPLPTMQRARQIGLDSGLRYVYLGNVPGDAGGDTYCPGCGLRLIARAPIHVRWNRVRKGCCPSCGTLIAGVQMSGTPPRGARSNPPVSRP
jgi:pyruvate formate lyase activating enzyme